MAAVCATTGHISDIRHQNRWWRGGIRYVGNKRYGNRGLSKIKSPSQVFRDEVGVMTMRGFGAGVLKESKEQAKVIRNASRFLTGEAQTGAIVTNSSDNSKTYNSNVSSTIQVQQMMVRDEQDMEAYNGAISMNGNMSGDFPSLAPGANAVSWTGNVTKVVIQPNWRYL